MKNRLEQEQKIYKMLKDVRCGNFEQYLKNKDEEYIEVKYLCDIVLPTGKIVTNDPICMYEYQALSETAPSGTFPVYIYVHHIKTDQRVSLAEIRFSEEIPEKYEFAVTDRFAELKFKNIYYMGYGVDSGTGGFMDKSLADSIHEYSNEQSEKMEKELIEQLNKTYIHTYSTLNYTPENENANMVGFSSGWGDGCYESYWGYDKNGNICSLTTYFDTLNCEIDWEAGIDIMKHILDAGYSHSQKITKKKLNLDLAAGYNHLAVFLRWMHEHNLLSDYLISEYPALPSIIEDKEIDLRWVLRLIPVFSSRLTVAHFNDIGQDFARKFYVFNSKDGYPACVDKYAEEYFGTKKYNSAEFQDEAYMFVPYDEEYYQGLSKYIDTAFEKYTSEFETSGPFKYDEKYKMFTAEINKVKFECEKIDMNLEMKAFEYANFYRKRLKTIVSGMMDEITSFYGDMSEDALMNALGKPTINLDNGLMTYCEHTLDDSHVIDVEFDGIFEEIIEVRIDG